jgi:hypothetical protein
MPRGDRTGPWGRGPMTGRSAGYCAGSPVPGCMNPVGEGPGRGGGRGRGFGWGRDRGRGRRFRRDLDIPDPQVFRRYEPDASYGPYDGGPQPEDEKSYLEDVLGNLESEIKEVKGRLKELSKEKGEK